MAKHSMRYVKLMLPTCSRVIALTAMVTGLPMSAQAAEPATLTLACKGTATYPSEGAKPDPISMGIIVNLANRTVQGFGFPARIIDVNEVTITFNDVEPLSLSTVAKTSEQHTYGTIDRVTGDVYATNTMKNTKTGRVVYSTDFTLACKPAQRMF